MNKEKIDYYKNYEKKAKKLSQEEMTNYCTAYEIEQKYGISKQKTNRAINNKILNACMLKQEDCIKIKWCIEKNKALEEFIKENRTK